MEKDTGFTFEFVIIGGSGTNFSSVMYQIQVHFPASAGTFSTSIMSKKNNDSGDRTSLTDS